MTSTSRFHCFRALPYELRREIYVLSTPPRLVPILENFPLSPEGQRRWEDDDEGLDKKFFAYESFAQSLGSGNLQFRMQLHPELTYFARNWRTQLALPPVSHKQTQLEKYGFTSSKPAYQPWPYTPETPEIPMDWLARHPEIAYELCRDSWFYSGAPIPAFLHVCVESRQALMEWGYQLAFGTRSYGPRTWFHFERDTLQISKINLDHLDSLQSQPHPNCGTLLSGCQYNFGQLDCTSLQSVKRLVVPVAGGHHWEISKDLVNVISLLPNLSDIFLEEWNADDLIEWFVDSDSRKNRRSDMDQLTIATALEREPRVLIKPEGIDDIASTIWFDPNHRIGPPRGFDHATPQLATDPWPRIFGLQARREREIPARHLPAIAAQVKAAMPFDTRLPALQPVHTCPESLHQPLLRGRHQFWHHYNQVQHDIEEGLDVSDFDTSALDSQFRFTMGAIRDTCLGMLNYLHHSPTMSLAFQEAKREKNALVRWFFEGPRISEPSLQPLQV